MSGRPARVGDPFDGVEARPSPTTGQAWDPQPNPEAQGAEEARQRLPRPRLRVVESAAPTTHRVWRETRFYAGLVAFFVLSAAIALALLVVAAAMMPGWVTVFITSDSMAPAIKRGDVVIGLANAPVERGRVIVFEDPLGAGLITHRVVDVTPDGHYLTAGDANQTADTTPVDPDRVRGSGRMLVPFVGWPLIWLADRAWGPLLLLVAATAVLAWWARYGLLDEYVPWEGAAAPSAP